MASRQNLVKEAFVELRTAINIVADNFENTSRNVITLHKLLNETNFEIKDIFSEVQNSLNVLQQKVYGIRMLSASPYSYMIQESVSYFGIVYILSSKLTASILELLSMG